MLIGAGVVLLALFGGGAALCVACRRFTGLKRKSADQTETQKRLESDDKGSTKRSNGGTTLLFQSARPVAAVSRTCGIGSLRRPRTRSESDTVSLHRFPASLRLGAFAFSSGATSTQRRQGAKAQRRFFHSGAGFTCGGSHIDYGVGGGGHLCAPDVLGVFEQEATERTEEDMTSVTSVSSCSQWFRVGLRPVHQTTCIQITRLL